MFSKTSVRSSTQRNRYRIARTLRMQAYSPFSHIVSRTVASSDRSAPLPRPPPTQPHICADTQFPSWCKRPTFHDDYYPAFNRPNVRLVDTDGNGVDQLTTNGVMANGTEYALDAVILRTGFRPPPHGWHGAHANMVIRGRNGQSFDERWDQGVSSLHGVITNGFPNLFFYGPFQAGVTANHCQTLDTITSHAAYMFSEAERRALAQGSENAKWTLEPTREAEEA